MWKYQYDKLTLTKEIVQFPPEELPTHYVQQPVFLTKCKWPDTVEPRLTNTLVRRTPPLNERFWPVPTDFPVKSCLKTPPWTNNLAFPVERTAVCPPKVSVREVIYLSACERICDVWSFRSTLAVNANVAYSESLLRKRWVIQWRLIASPFDKDIRLQQSLV